MRKVLLALAGLLAVPLAYLLAAPTNVEPVRWTVPAAPSTTDGPYARNERLRGIERIAQVGVGPESVAIDASGGFVAGFADGRIARFAADGADYRLLATTGGRPLGIALHPDGSVIVADAHRGLLRIDSTGTLRVLATAAEGEPFRFTDDVVVDAAGAHAYFTDASAKFGLEEGESDVIEHGGHGRLLRYDFADGATRVLLRGLQLANGVALGPEEEFVLVDETGAYRVTRYWLRGAHAGTSEVFVDDLPGFPDNVTFNGRDRFWVALYAPRSALLDTLGEHPFLRKMIARLVAVLPHSSARESLAMGYDVRGRLVANLQYAGGDGYAPITSVREVGKWLYFGSTTERGVGRLPLHSVIAAEQ